MFMVAGTAQNCGAGVKIYGYVPGAADDMTEGDRFLLVQGHYLRMQVSLVPRRCDKLEQFA